MRIQDFFSGCASVTVQKRMPCLFCSRWMENPCAHRGRAEECTQRIASMLSPAELCANQNRHPRDHRADSSFTLEAFSSEGLDPTPPFSEGETPWEG